MRSHALARTLVGAAAVIGLAAGGLATAGTTFAAPAQTARTGSVSILATHNFGLSSQQAKNVQCFMRGAPASSTGSIDGQLGTNSWKAMQRHLEAYWNYTDSIDGDPGPNTQAAFKRFANDMSVFYPGVRALRAARASGCPAGPCPGAASAR